MRHIVGKLSTSSFQRYKVCANRSSDEGVMAPGSRGVGAVFVHFSDEDSGQTGDAIGEPRVPRRSRSRYLSNAPGLADQLVASRKDSAREGGSCAAYFCKVPGFAEIRAWTCEIWPREQRPPEVFLVRLRAVFRSGFRLAPINSWRSESSTSCMNVSSFQCAQGSQINLLRVRKTLCASVATSVGKFRNFQQNLISSACFHARGRRSSRCRISTILVSSESLRYLLFNGTGLAQRRAWELLTIRKLHVVAEVNLLPKGLGSRTKLQRVGENLCANVASQMGCFVNNTYQNLAKCRTVFFAVLATTLSFLVRFRPVKYGIEALDILYTLVKGRSVRSSFWSGQWSGQTLVKLGQPWSNLVELGQSSPNSWRCIPDYISRVSGHGTAKNLPQFTCHSLSDTLALNRLTHGSKVKVGFRFLVFSLNSTFPTSAFSFPSSSDLALRKFVRLSEMSDRGSGSGGHRRSDRLAKGKAVMYAPESSPDTDDEYDAMEDVRTCLDASIARNLQAELDAEAAGPASSAARPPPRPGVVIGRSARLSETTRHSPQPGVTTGPNDTPSVRTSSSSYQDYVALGFRYPPQGGIRPRYPVIVEISDTPLLTNLLAHPSSLVRRCQEPPESVGRGGWSEFSRLLAASRPEYREFLIELGFGPFLSIPYVSVYHPAVWCFIERFFHHTGTFHLSTCEMAVLLVDWSAILGIRFGGRAPPSEPVDGFKAREILGLADRDAIKGSRRPSVRIRYLADVLRRDREEPPTELRYRQWAAYLIFSCFLGNDRSIVPTPIVGGSVCAKILSDPLQLGPRAKTLRQEVHFSYHTQLSDRQELLRSSRNLSQKLTPWHKEHSDGLRSQDHISRTQTRLCARPVPLKSRVFLTRNKLICEPGHIGKRTHPCTTWNSRIAKNLSGPAGIPIGKLPSNGPKTPRWTSARGAISHKSKLGFPRIRNLAKIGSASFPTVPRTSTSGARSNMREGQDLRKNALGAKRKPPSRAESFLLR
uniref:Aminotransferase-like plant mobile domain-containing protein n=1 Tax=Fagus sylvatica TaxID=28930 RepID=A0A2N9F750_FAGSY